MLNKIKRTGYVLFAVGIFWFVAGGNDEILRVPFLIISGVLASVGAGLVWAASEK